MKRRNLFEFGDQPWLCGPLRHAYMDVLNLMLRLGGQYRRMHEPLLDWVQRAGGDAVLDLGSGGGGPMDSMLQAAESANLAMPKIVLSDLFPNLAQFAEMRDRYGAASWRTL